MHTIKHVLLLMNRYVPKMFWSLVLLCFFVQPAHADILDAYNLAPFVPMVLEIMMNIATSLYNFFVGNGTGLIYILVYAFAGFSIAMYLIKMHLPKDWLSFFGFSDGGEMWDGKQDGMSIIENVLKPCLRVIVACVVLLQIKPVYVTEWLVNPFLEFGAVYTESILTSTTNTFDGAFNAPECPESITVSGWISKSSCDFLIQPVYIISKANNDVIRYGFEFIKSGLSGFVSFAPFVGGNILNLITGILLIIAFIASNVFMALLIIQGIFDFCIALIIYPFNVLAWVAKKSDKWFDILPAFNQIIDALKKLVITMIACAFILCVNVAIIHALFNWTSNTVGGMGSILDTTMNFGKHSMLWIASILTFFLMQNIFTMTRERLDMYTSTKPKLYNDVTGAAKITWNKIKSTPDTVKKIVSGVKKVAGKK